eukprot:372265_1
MAQTLYMVDNKSPTPTPTPTLSVPQTLPIPTLGMVHTKSRSSSGLKPRLRNILQDNELFHSYMQHLIREFSMECLLAFVEFRQYKIHALQVFNIEDPATTMCVTFPKSVPQSDIVYNDDTNVDKDSFKIKCYKLFLKYIESNAEFEINISWQHRVALTQLMGDYDRWMSMNVTVMELYQMFDDPMREMYRLMNHARMRFTDLEE